MKKGKKISSSMEDYLEAIAILKKKKKVARVKDISRMLDVETPSVTSALKSLSSNGLVIHEKYGYVDLTSHGEKLAANIRQRHEVLLKFLTEILGIDPETAAEDACKMEHSISRETFKKLTKFVELITADSSEQNSPWLKDFEYYLKTGRRQPSTKESIAAEK